MIIDTLHINLIGKCMSSECYLIPFSHEQAIPGEDILPTVASLDTSLIFRKHSRLLLLFLSSSSQVNFTQVGSSLQSRQQVFMSGTPQIVLSVLALQSRLSLNTHGSSGISIHKIVKNANNGRARQILRTICSLTVKHLLPQCSGSNGRSIFSSSSIRK